MRIFSSNALMFAAVAAGAFIVVVLRGAGWLLVLAGLLVGLFWAVGVLEGPGEAMVVTILAGLLALATARAFSRLYGPKSRIAR